MSSVESWRELLMDHRIHHCGGCERRLAFRVFLRKTSAKAPEPPRRPKLQGSGRADLGGGIE